MSGRVVHFEIPFDDADRARAFYQQAFDWDINAVPDMDYTMVTTGPSDGGPPGEPGFINGGMLKRGAPVAGPVLTVEVDDIDGSLERIESLGGMTVQAKAPVADMGFAAYFTDPEGNLMGLWQNA